MHTLVPFRLGHLRPRAGALVADLFLRLHNHLGEAIVQLFPSDFLALLVGST